MFAPLDPSKDDDACLFITARCVDSGPISRSSVRALQESRDCSVELQALTASWTESASIRTRMMLQSSISRRGRQDHGRRTRPAGAAGSRESSGHGRWTRMERPYLSQTCGRSDATAVRALVSRLQPVSFEGSTAATCSIFQVTLQRTPSIIPIPFSQLRVL